MALDITYYGGTDATIRQIPGIMLTRVSATLTASSESLGTPPSGAAYAILTPGEDAVVSNNGSAASATNGQKVLTGVPHYVEIVNGAALLGMTA